jgi:pilus assembly protein CpaB
MSIRTVLIVVLALVFGLSAAAGINALRNQEPPTPKADTQPIVVAALDIARGSTITSDMLAMRDYPTAVVPTGAITNLEAAINRSVAIPMLKGDPLIDNKLAPRGAGRGMAALIPKGMRTISIQVPSVASAGSGFVLPGNRVDVMLIPGQRPTPEPGTAASELVVQNVEVWAVGSRVEAPAENKVDSKELKEVTLLVTPEQATTLVGVQDKGSFHLLLRNPDDNSIHVRKDPPPKPREEPNKVAVRIPAQIRTLRGTQDSNVEVQTPDDR